MALQLLPMLSEGRRRSAVTYDALRYFSGATVAEKCAFKGREGRRCMCSLTRRFIVTVQAGGFL